MCSFDNIVNCGETTTSASEEVEVAEDTGTGVEVVGVLGRKVRTGNEKKGKEKEEEKKEKKRREEEK